MNRRMFLMAAAAPAFVAGCALRPGPPPPGSLQDVDALTRGITQMAGHVDPAEARRAATVAYAETHRLALAYQITDGPLIHNAKVNAGTKPRGLCWHWAEDLEARLKAEGFATLALHRAIANADNRIRIDHSTAIIAPQGAPWETGMVLDPWRRAGVLTWVRVREDSAYAWEARMAVLRRHGRIRYIRQGADIS
ncbi:MAG: hypothetical protein AAF744_00285 [Pseudomonadota bacterium]